MSLADLIRLNLEKDYYSGLATKQAEDLRKSKAEADKAELENKPAFEVLGESPERTQTLLNSASSTPIPSEDLISGKLDTFGNAINARNGAIKKDQEKFGTAPLSAIKTQSEIEEKKALANKAIAETGDSQWFNHDTGEVLISPPSKPSGSWEKLKLPRC